MKNLHLDLVRVTEAGAIAAAAWVGKGNKLEADRAATDAMRRRLNEIDFHAQVAIGEGEKDKSYGIYRRENLGSKRDNFVEAKLPEFDLAIDPIEGTTPTANGGYEAMSTLAVANFNSMYRPMSYYMDKLVGGHRLVGAGLSISNTIEGNIRLASNVLKKPVEKMTVVLLDRTRNLTRIEQLRQTGVRIKLISDCDLTACVAACLPQTGIDLYMGVGGSPEGILGGCAVKCLGGFMEAIEYDNKGYVSLGGQILDLNDLVKGEATFVATGITKGSLLRGVKYRGSGSTALTHSLAMRSESGTLRWLETFHGN